MVTLFLRQGENGKQVLLSFPATTPAEKADVAATMESLKSMSKTVTIQGAASEVMNLGLYLSGVDLAAEGEVERIDQLADRLEHMSEVDCDKFAGMLDANSVSGTKDILQLTGRLDDYVILQGCGSAQSIGKYLVGCGAFPVPEKLIGYINYEAVGTEFQDAHGGAPCARGYVVQKGNLPRAILEDLNIDLQQRTRPKLLTLYLRAADGKERELTLPVNNAKLEALQQLGTAQIDHVQYFAPYLSDLIPAAGNPDIQDYNELAKMLGRMDAENGELLKYASVLSAEKPETTATSAFPAACTITASNCFKSSLIWMTSAFLSWRNIRILHDTVRRAQKVTVLCRRSSDKCAELPSRLSRRIQMK